MNQEQFVAVVKQNVVKSGVEGLIETYKNPPGRQPSESLLRMSNFYKALEDEQKSVLKEIILNAADTSVFGFLCLLDGVSSLNAYGGDSGHLKLIYVNDRLGMETMLNNSDGDFLHDIYNAEC
ncbi:hypothetical protein G6M26_08485 [Agrobacterium tumefaciens]|nr:hypothetical protein [Agrobacterium tumefaciens]NTE18556.1 hypothetical protein [Agrobacterium tumefaciens]